MNFVNWVAKVKEMEWNGKMGWNVEFKDLRTHVLVIVNTP